MKKWIIVVGGALLLFAMGAAVAVLYTGSTDTITRTADTLSPPGGWKLVSEQIEPPRLVCASICPDLARVWKPTGEAVAYEPSLSTIYGMSNDLRQCLEGAGSAVCSLSGEKDGYV